MLPNSIIKTLLSACIILGSIQTTHANTVDINSIFKKIEKNQSDPKLSLLNIEPWYELLEFRYDFDTLYEKREITLRVKPSSISEINHKESIKNLERQKFKIAKSLSVNNLKQAFLKMAVSINEINERKPLLERKLTLLERRQSIFESDIAKYNDNTREIFELEKKVKLLKLEIERSDRNLKAYYEEVSKFTPGVSKEVRFSGFDSFDAMLGRLNSLESNNKSITLQLTEVEHNLNLQNLGYQNDLVSDFLTFFEVSKEMGDSDLTQFKFGFKLPLGISNTNSQAFNAAYASERTRTDVEISKIATRETFKNKQHDIISKIDYYEFLSASDYAKKLKKQISTLGEVGSNNIEVLTALEIVDTERQLERSAIKNQIIADYYLLVFSFEDRVSEK